MDEGVPPSDLEVELQDKNKRIIADICYLVQLMRYLIFMFVFF